jgi:hypothetical protein
MKKRNVIQVNVDSKKEITHDKEEKEKKQKKIRNFVADTNIDNVGDSAKGHTVSFTSFELGLLFFLACTSLGVYTVIIAGWSSNSGYSLLGALRALAQTISYEVRLAEMELQSRHFEYKDDQQCQPSARLVLAGSPHYYYYYYYHHHHHCHMITKSFQSNGYT